MVARTWLVLLLSLSLLLPLSVSANGPEWDVGDKWAVGTEEDFSEVFNKATEDIREGILANASGFMEYDYENEGKIGVYYISEVVNDTDGLYEVASELGFYIHAYTKNTFDLSGVPVKGNHSDVTVGLDDDDLPTFGNVKTRDVTMTLEAGVDFTIKLATREFYDQTDLSLEAINVTWSAGAGYEIRGSNLPDIDFDGMGGRGDGGSGGDQATLKWLDVKYTNAGWGGEASVSFVVDLDFEPAVNLYDLPIEQGDVWGGVTNITAKGDFGGIIDLEEPEGVPQQYLDEFYSNITRGFKEDDIDKTINKWSDLFPLPIPSDWMPFEDLNDDAQEEDVDLDLRIENNRFVWGPISSPEPQHYNFTTGEMRNITLPGGTTISAFEIISADEDPGDDRARGSEHNFADTVLAGEQSDHYLNVDENPEEVLIDWQLVDENGTANSEVTMRLVDPYGSTVWELTNQAAGSDHAYVDLYNDGIYKLEVEGLTGNMSYDIDLDIEYQSSASEEEGFDLLGDLELKPFVGSESGQVLSVEANSDVLEEAGIDLIADPIEYVDAESALNDKVDTSEPTKGGTNEEREWKDVTNPNIDEPLVEDDDSPLPAPGLLASLSLMIMSAICLSRYRRCRYR